MKNIAVFASGNGSNFEAIVNASYNQIKVALLVCDNPKAFVIERAKKYDLDVYVFNPKIYHSKREYEEDIVKQLKYHQIDLICLAGYMRFVGPTLLEAYEGKIINIHPSLLPEFKGKDSIKAAYDAKVSKTGVTIHYVNDQIDDGQIIMQRSILTKDLSLKALEDKIHQLEHQLFPQVIKKILED